MTYRQLVDIDTVAAAKVKVRESHAIVTLSLTLLALISFLLMEKTK